MEKSQSLSASSEDLDFVLSELLNVIDEKKAFDREDNDSAGGIHSVALPITIRKRLLYNSSLN